MYVLVSLTHSFPGVLDEFWRSTNNSAVPQMCPVKEACVGGGCATGYYGPFCGICETGYYRWRATR